MSRTGRFAFVAIAAALVLSTAPVRLASQGQRSPASSQVRNSAVSGVVTDGATGRPIPSVVVSFYSPAASQNTVTDSKGRFVFRNLPAAEACRLSAAKPGYVAGGLSKRDRSFATTPIALAENEWIADANIVMWRPGSISGTVLDEKREPVVDVPVRVLVGVPVAGNVYWATGPVAKTDDRGMYRIPNLRGGRYIVNLPSVQSAVPPETSQSTIQGVQTNTIVPQALTPVPGIDLGRGWLVLGQYATPPPGGREAYPAIYYPNARSLTEATLIELANSEDRRDIDFMMQPAPAVRVSGRVLGLRDGAGGLVVRLLQDGAETLGLGSEQATALAAPDGTFTMVNIPAGSYVLEASSRVAEINATTLYHMPATPGLVRGTLMTSWPGLPGTDSGSFRIITLSGAGTFFARQKIAVGADDVLDVVLTLERGATVSGRVVREDGVATIASVGAEPASGDPRLATAVSDPDVRRDPNGAFAIRGLQRGQYLLRAGNTVKSITVGGDDYTYRPIDMSPGVDVTGVIITLAAAPSSLSGTVRTVQGAPVREAAVIVFPADRSQWTNFGLDPLRIRTVTFFGKQQYQFRRLPGGVYYAIAVDASMVDAWTDPRFFPAASPLATRFTLEWGKEASVDLVLQRVVLR